MRGFLKCCGFAKNMLLHFGSDGLVRKYKMFKISCLAVISGIALALAVLAGLFYVMGARFGLPSCVCRYINAGD